MSDSEHKYRRAIRFIFAGLGAIQVLVLGRAAVNDVIQRHGSAFDIGLAVAIAAIYLPAIAVLARVWRPTARSAKFIFVALAVALSVRLYLPPLLLRHFSANEQKERNEPKVAAHESSTLVLFLRTVDAAEEQFRLRSGRYTDEIDSLRTWAEIPGGAKVSILARGNRSWSAQATLDGITCSVWSLDSGLRKEQWQPEGSPTCGKPEKRDANELVPTVLAPPAKALAHFTDADIRGTWDQHRADVHRTGMASGTDGRPHRWDARVGGSLRSAVSIAGNQVFVGAHGNGELVALTLDSGKLGFRLRAPNWIHHEPAVTKDLLIVGFGNNEWVNSTYIGTEPSGVVAYDRLTGVERWRRYTKGSVMGVPVIRDSIVAVTTASGEPVGFRLRDGAELWWASVSGMTPMGNPLLIDSVMIYGAEATTACAVNVETGRLVYCIPLERCGVDPRPVELDSLTLVNCWGAGHASPALAGDLVLQVFERDFIRKKNADRLLFYLEKISGIPRRRRDPEVGEQILVAFDWRNGKLRWRTSLGRGTFFPAGHIAGTPTVVDNVAYVPAASNGNVVAVNVKSGRLIWSTPLRASRGSVVVARGFVLTATLDKGFVVLNAATGRIACRQQLPAVADRAGLTLAGETGILTLRNGSIMARPLADWLACRA